MRRGPETFYRLENRRCASGPPASHLPELSPAILDPYLLDCAADLGEHIAGVPPDQPDRAYDDNENDSQHHGILSDVLSFFI